MFTFDMFLGMIVLGLYGYFKEFFNVLDFVIVCTVQPCLPPPDPRCFLSPLMSSRRPRRCPPSLLTSLSMDIAPLHQHSSSASLSLSSARAGLTLLIWGLWMFLHSVCCVCYGPFDLFDTSRASRSASMPQPG